MKKKVAIIGVTGAVGQEFVQSLNDHPWFEVTQIAASERSAGKKYVDAIRDDSGIVAWDVGGEIPDYIRDMPVLTIDEIMYIDRVHYSPEFSKKIAHEIYKKLK